MASMSMFKALQATIDKGNTTNSKGCVAYTFDGAGKEVYADLLGINHLNRSQVGTFQQSLMTLCEKYAYELNKVKFIDDTIVLFLIYLRSINDGKGERRLFYTGVVIMVDAGLTWVISKVVIPFICRSPQACIVDLLKIYEMLASKDTISRQFIMNEIVHTFASLLVCDLNTVVTQGLHNAAKVSEWMERVRSQFGFYMDIDAMERMEPSTGRVSLAAKWAPSERTKQYSGFQKHLLWVLFFENDVDHQSACEGDGGLFKRWTWAQKTYREMKQLLTAHIYVPEQMMSSGNYRTLDPAKIPGRAFLKYREAYLRKTTVRAPTEEKEDRVSCARAFESFLSKEKGKVRARTVTPTEIFRTCMGVKNYTMKTKPGNHTTAHAQWQSKISDFLKKNGPCRFVAMCDASGSMYDEAIVHSLALSCFFCECAPALRFVLSFAEDTKVIAFQSNFLETAEEIVRQNQDHSKTNFFEAMKILAQTKNRTGYCPEALLVFSDMEFDAACQTGGGVSWDSTYRNICKLFADQAPPVIVFWNLAANSTTLVSHGDTPGVITVSGYSDAVLHSLMKCDLESLKKMTPVTALETILNGASFKDVRILLQETRNEAAESCGATDGWLSGVVEHGKSQHERREMYLQGVKQKYQQLTSTKKHKKVGMDQTIRFHLDSQYDAGHIVGPNGDRLKRIESKYATSITRSKRKRDVFVIRSENPENTLNCARQMRNVFFQECGQRQYKQHRFYKETGDFK